jgi:hypothetical protein
VRLANDADAAHFHVGEPRYYRLGPHGELIEVREPLPAGKPNAMVTAVDTDRGIVTVESLEDAIMDLAVKVAAVGGRTSQVFVSPANAPLVIALHRKWRRRELRAARMARKRRRGWA